MIKKDKVGNGKFVSGSTMVLISELGNNLRDLRGMNEVIANNDMPKKYLDDAMRLQARNEELVKELKHRDVKIDAIFNKYYTKSSKKFAVGGEVGNVVNFRGDYGKKRSGIVTGKKNNGYVVSTDDGNVFVESYEIDGFEEAPVAKKKRFGFFEGGGSVDKYKLFEGYDHYKGFPIYQDVAIDEDDEYEGDWHKDKSEAEKELKEMNSKKLEGGGVGEEMIETYVQYKSVILERVGENIYLRANGESWKLSKSQLNDLLEELEDYSNPLSASEYLMSVDKSKYENITSDKFEGGGEIQSKIEKLNKVVNSKMLPESAKLKARAEIERLEKELHESKETKSEEKAEHSDKIKMYISEIKRLTGTSNEAVEKFIDDNKLSEDDVYKLMQGLGQKKLHHSEFVTALVGTNKDFKSAFIKAVKSESKMIHPEHEETEKDRLKELELFKKANLNKETPIKGAKYSESHYKNLPIYNDYEWYGFDNGKHLFVKKKGGKFVEIKATDEDLENGNIEFMTKNDLSNENKVIAKKEKVSPNDVRHKLKEGYSYSWVSVEIGEPDKIELFGFTIYDKNGKDVFKSSMIYDDLKAVKLGVNNRLSTILNKDNKDKKALLPKFKVGDSIQLKDGLMEMIIDSYSTNRQGEIVYKGHFKSIPSEKFTEKESELEVYKKDKNDIFSNGQDAYIWDLENNGKKYEFIDIVGDYYRFGTYSGGKARDFVKFKKSEINNKVKNKKWTLEYPFDSKGELKKPKPDHKALLAKIKAKKTVKDYSNEASLNPKTGERRKRNESSDKKREALPLGKRVSKNGNVYWEGRLNRGDVDKEDKFEGGGEIKDWDVITKRTKDSKWEVANKERLNLKEAEKLMGELEKSGAFHSVDSKLNSRFKEGGEIGKNSSGWGLKFLNW